MAVATSDKSSVLAPFNFVSNVRKLAFWHCVARTPFLSDRHHQHPIDKLKNKICACRDNQKRETGLKRKSLLTSANSLGTANIVPSLREHLGPKTTIEFMDHEDRG